MESFEIYRKLTTIFREIFDDDNLVVVPELTAADVDEWDSLRHIQLVLSVEREFSLRFSASEVANLENVADFVELIGRKSRLTTSSRDLGWEDLAEGMKATVDFTVTPNDMRRFADLSGDYNALHLDAALAERKGYRGVVVYGALLVAKISQLIGMELPGRHSVWVGLSLQFCKPLYVGQKAQLEGTVASLSDATRTACLAITVRAAGRLLAKGTAEVLLVER